MTAAGAQFLRPLIPAPRLLPDDDDEDVAAERAAVEMLLQHRLGRAGSLAGQGEGASDNAVEIHGLQKVYPGSSRLRSALQIVTYTL